METTLTGEGVSTGGNVTVTNFAAMNFVAADNWHLTGTTPAAVRTGGLNSWHSAEDWSAWFPTNTSGNPCDKDENDRTPYDTDTNTTGWSMGAYEQD